METLVVVDNRNHQQYYCRNHGRSPGQAGSFDFHGFRGMSCRAFQSGEGLLPSPFKSRTNIHVPKKAFSPSFSPKTPSPLLNKAHTSSRRTSKTSTFPVPIKIDFENQENYSKKELSISERWAGPAYSNSPPPSSLPIPKFSFKTKRTVSLDLPSSASKIDLDPFSKSAPSSPTREFSLSPSFSVDSPDSATQTLRRILNLDIADE